MQRMTKSAPIACGLPLIQNRLVAAANRLGISVENCVVVGDSIWDMLAAGRRRALSVGLLSGGYSQAELEQAGAFRVCTDPADMLEHIEDLGFG